MALIIFQTIGTMTLIVIFYRWGFRRGIDRGIKEMINTFNEIEFTDEQVELMNKKFFNIGKFVDGKKI